MALEMQNFEALSPPVVKKITWWTLVSTVSEIESMKEWKDKLLIRQHHTNL